MINGYSATESSPQRGAWLVYINGLEIPCPSVSVRYGVWQIPECSLSFAPHRALQRLGKEDRVEVVIFFLDTLTNPSQPEFKLMMEGEIIGWSYRNTPTGRQMSFDVVADISMFKQLHFFFMNTVDAIVGRNITPGSGAEGPATPGVFYPYSLFKQGLVNPGGGSVPADITRPYDILFNIVKGMTSSLIPPEQLAIPSINFFARWVRKRNFQNRFAALPQFEDVANPNAGVFPVFQAVQADFALKTMQESLSPSVGDAGNMFDVMQKLLGVALYELAMIPTAPCFRVQLASDSTDGTILGPPATTPPTDPSQAALQPLRIINYFVKPQLLFAVPPKCNVVFPSMLKAYQYNENYLTQPTRTYVNDSLITGALNTTSAFVSSALTVGYPPEVNAAAQQRGQQVPQINDDSNSTSATPIDLRTNGKNVLVFPEEFYKGPVLARHEIPSWFQLLQSKLSSSKPTDEQTGGQSSAENYDQLQQFYKLNALYVQYEHFRSRYEKRGGAIDMRFNPFILPGFPCAVFDQRDMALDTLGYITSVSQTMAVTGGGGTMSTSAAFSYGRTFQEMFELLLPDMAQLGIMGSAPADPIDQNRIISQDPANAEEFYLSLLYGRSKVGTASFAFQDIVGMVDAKGNTVPIVINGPTVADRGAVFDNATQNPAIAALVAANATVNAAIPVTTNLTSTQIEGPITATTVPYEGQLVPLASALPLFTSPDLAMQWVSRPICTLSEYIQFLNGGVSVATAVANGSVSGPNRYFGYQNAGNSNQPSALYYTRLYTRRPGPGTNPGPASIGATVTPPPANGTTSDAAPYTADKVGVPADFPQTRAAWDTVLEAYRDDILGSLAPLT